MFYLLIQAIMGSESWTGERFVCFEASSQEEANERAEWFGIDLQEYLLSDLIKKWDWHSSSCGMPRPQINMRPIETSAYAGGWVVVYRNGNLRSSFAVHFSQEPDNGDRNDLAEAT